MYRITRNSKTGHFHLTFHSRNGRILFQTETFTQKPSVFVNIRATLKEMGCDWVMLQDDSLLTGPKVYVIGVNKKMDYEADQQPRKFPLKYKL